MSKIKFKVWLLQDAKKGIIYYQNNSNYDRNRYVELNKRNEKRGIEMTEYIIELYEKGARKPYQKFVDSLPDRARPRYRNSAECFDFKLSHLGGRALIRYKSNGKLVAESYIDANGNGRLRWKE